VVDVVVAGTVEETTGAIVVEPTMVVAVIPAMVVGVWPSIVDDGITSPVISESSVYFDGRHAPGPVGASPRAEAMDETRTCRPASVG
jgi:hypothetical protein